ncbi:MAG TPA: hydrolase [Candidatus Limnocylindria bacterium]|nr:hydrolase [Candidatus Limnocylindria bacterium]
MNAHICATCGVQQAPSAAPPPRCPICEDERQYVRQGGQAWTTLGELAAKGHRILVRELEPGLLGVGVEPAVGIGQRALLVRTAAGNLLWDCVGYVDDAGVEAVRAAGGVAAIAFSHPHFYGVMVEWSRAFGGCPMYVPSADREWVQRDDPAIVEWAGTREVVPGVTLVQVGGHFDGSAMVHWPAGAGGKGALLVGDTITVVPDVRAVSFMRSYPNLIPLPAGEIRRMVAVARRYPADRIYGGWWDRVVREDGMRAVERSALRYLRWSGAEERL